MKKEFKGMKHTREIAGEITGKKYLLTEMKVGKYLIQRYKSIFTNRSGKEDCNIYQKVKRMNFVGYEAFLRIECETGDVIRQYNKMPGCISMEFLKQEGFID